MITKINKSNSGSYEALFYKVSQELMSHDESTFQECDFGSANAIIKCERIEITAEEYEPQTYYIAAPDGKGFVLDTRESFDPDAEYYTADTITSLNEYFYYIDRIKEIKGGIYTRLPLDENMFEIDADKRTITVPSNFNANGVSVQGDEISEILYFKIDRYYDATDLATQQVFIEWKNAAGQDGVSLPWIIDIDSEPNYIIFGWPLTTRITGTAGKVQFAVRFYTPDDEDTSSDRLIYSFSTLTQSVVIKPSLNFNIPNILVDSAQIDDATSLISNRFTSSPLEGDGSSVAEAPEFLNIEILGFVSVGPKKTTEENKYINLTGDDYDEPITLIAQAVKNDAGILSYRWVGKQVRREDNTPSTDDLQNIGESKTVYRLTTDTEAVPGKVYYKENEGGFSHSVFEPPTWDSSSDAYIPIYEKFATLRIDKVGAYKVQARNRSGNANAETFSETIVVPYPEAPVIPEHQNLPDKKVFSSSTENSVIELTSNAIIRTGSTINPNKQGNLSYIWEKSNTEDGEYSPIADATNSNYMILSSIDLETNTVKVEDGRLQGDGYYRVKTTLSLNGEESSVISTPCRITHKPAIFTVRVENQQIYENEVETKPLTVQVEFPEICSERYDFRDDLGELSDKIEYQWYRYYSGNGDPVVDRENAENGIYTENGDDLLGDGISVKENQTENAEDLLARGATENRFKPEGPGTYFCLITTIFNGYKETRSSAFFTVLSEI